MKARVVILAVLAVAAAALAAASLSSALFTTASQTQVTASADHVRDWLHVYSQGTDPDGLTGYARQQYPAPGPVVATGQDDGIAIDLGSYPDTNTTYTFNRTVTIKTPAAFPEPAVTQVTVTVTRLPDPGGQQVLRNAWLNTIGSAGGVTTMTLGPNQKRQLNLQMRARRQWGPGDVFHPVVVLTVTFTGGPADYYVYSFPCQVTVI